MSVRILHSQMHLVILGLCFLAPAQAHEYWLERATQKNPEKLSLELTARVGEGLQSHNLQKFSSDSFERLWVNGYQALPREVTLSNNDKSLHIKPLVSKTTSVAYREKPALHRYSKFSEFEQFAKEEGVEYIVNEHLEADLPEDQFYEQFTRHTKALFCYSPEPTVDTNTPMEYEWIALGNIDNRDTQVIHLQLLNLDIPLTAKSVTVFANYAGDDDIKNIRLKTDSQGIVSISNRPGRFLINATLVRRADPKTTVETGAIWESHWVSLTFDNQCA